MSIPRFFLLIPVVLIPVAAVADPAAAQALGTAKAGPVIHSAGAVFAVPSPDFTIPADHTFKVAFDVSQGSSGADQVTVGFNSVARFLNMHAQAGVSRDRVHVALVVHGSAAQDLLDHPAYRERTGHDNPNKELLEELVEAGVRIVLCGQSAMGRGIRRDGLLDGVQMALSAMTAHQVLRAEGYGSNPF